MKRSLCKHTYLPGGSSRATKLLAYPTYWSVLYENMKLCPLKCCKDTANLEKMLLATVVRIHDAQECTVSANSSKAAF